MHIHSFDPLPQIVYAKQALKDAKKLSASGLKLKTQELLTILEMNPSKIHHPMKSWLVILLEPIQVLVGKQHNGKKSDMI